MENIYQTFLERKGDLLKALLQHLNISFFALLIAALIAIPLGIYFSRHQKGAQWMLQLASIFQTIPSLALLGLLIPVVGIGTPPALIALVIYAILPIFQNTYTGLVGIDSSLKEASEAFGMSFWQKLKKVELPLALPMIISGIRTSLVMIIGTATLAALIGAGGLGTFILLGIDRNNPSLTLIGAVSAALLAIVFNFVIQFLQKRSAKLALVAILLLGVGLGGWQLKNSDIFAKREIVIAGKLGSEPDILIEMYKALIEEENPKVNVTLKPNFGKTSFLFSALEHGQIDIYPEFTGTVLGSLVHYDKELPKDAQETYALANELLQKEFQMTLLPPMKYENTYALTVTNDFAEKNHLETISDLKKVQNQMTAGFTLEFADREDGYLGLNQTQGLQFKEVKTMEPALRYEALKNNNVQIIDAYSTDAEIKAYDLKILGDDLHYFPSYRGAPLMLTSFKEEHPEIVKALDKLTNQITEDEMAAMNYEVQVEKKAPKTVANEYLRKNQLLKEVKK